MTSVNLYENLGIGTSIGFGAGLAVTLLCNLEPSNFDLNHYIQDVIRWSEIIPYTTLAGFFGGGLVHTGEVITERAEQRGTIEAKKRNLEFRARMAK